MADEYETTEVLICGCGPTGAMLSAFLGRSNVANIVVEKESGVTTDPRGIALDDDGIRLLQALGLYDNVFSDIGACSPGAQFVSGVHFDLHKKPFLSLDTSSMAGTTGHVGLLTHKQPILEKHIRSVISSAKSSDLRSSCTLTSISEDADWVYTTYNDIDGVEHKIRSRFLIGADGKTGFTRKKYLEPKGVHMLWAEQTKYQESWVALNWKITPPSIKTHPDFPLWKKGYSPEEVYDLFFPRKFRFLCNPQRPAVCGRFGLQSDRLWRFEFVVAAGEDDYEMAKPDMIRKVVFPYLRHPGRRYGLAEDVEFPEDCIEVLRCRPFRFYARSCDKWSVGRVALCGDAAHVFPPFGGQGIASGFRDAVSLSWRLAVACHSRKIDHERLLKGWYTERKQQLEKSLASTVRNGDMVNSHNPLTIFIRDWGLWLLQLIPSWKTWLELGPRNAGATQYKFEDGMSFVPSLSGGIAFSQTFCRETHGEKDVGQVRLTDDIIFAPEKESLFQVAVLLSRPSEVDAARRDLEGLDEISALISPEEATFFVPRESAGSGWIPQSTSNKIYRTATGDEWANSSLSDGLPEPRGYREYDMWTSVNHKRYVIVRTDRFVFAACNDRRELELAARKLADMFPL